MKINDICMSDLISRAAAIEIIRSMTINLSGKDIFTPEAKKSVIGVLDEIDAVDAEPVRHGKWAHLGGDEWCCTQCGDVIYTDGSWEKPTKKYCNECGAKMDAEVDGDA